MMSEEAREQDDEYRPDWDNRQRVIFGSLGFCAGVIAYLLIWGEADSRLHETIAIGAFFLAGGIIGTYVFNASWESVTRLRK